jgi:hypothetical protein
MLGGGNSYFTPNRNFQTRLVTLARYIPAQLQAIPSERGLSTGGQPAASRENGTRVKAAPTNQRRHLPCLLTSPERLTAGPAPIHHCAASTSAADNIFHSAYSPASWRAYDELDARSGGVFV